MIIYNNKYTSSSFYCQLVELCQAIIVTWCLIWFYLDSYISWDIEVISCEGI